MKNPTNHFNLLAGIASVLLFASGCQTASRQPAPAPASAPVAVTSPSSKESQAAMTPRQALAELRAGNARFVAGRPRLRQPASDVKATAPGQYPYAIVLSCIDSRQPIELVLDQGVGDIFSARVAGNVLNDDIVGSMEFACKVSGAKLIAVIGHSNCGAIKGAIDRAELGSLTGLLARIEPAIAEVMAVPSEPRSSKDHVLVEKVADANVRLVMRQILERSPVLREMLERGEIGIAGGMYDLDTGIVHFYDK